MNQVTNECRNWRTYIIRHYSGLKRARMLVSVLSVLDDAIKAVPVCDQERLEVMKARQLARRIEADLNKYLAVAG